jgi:CubicO group peptidase (beta-lactamase class C family)
LGQNIATEIAEPLGVDVFVGLPEAEEARVAPLIEGPPPDLGAIEDAEAQDMYARLGAALADPSSLFFRASTINGVLTEPRPALWNRRDVHAAELGGGGGIANGRALARIYGACVSEVDGIRLLSDRTVDDATRELASGADEVIFQHNRPGTGLVLPGLSMRGMSESSFGHAGAGGALGFGDPVHRVGFGYVGNAGGAGGSRARELVAAVQGCLEVGEALSLRCASDTRWRLVPGTAGPSDSPPCANGAAPPGEAQPDLLSCPASRPCRGSRPGIRVPTAPRSRPPRFAVRSADIAVRAAGGGRPWRRKRR